MYFVNLSRANEFDTQERSWPVSRIRFSFTNITFVLHNFPSSNKRASS